MISSIEITRFRGIREGKLEDLTPLVVLVGANASGKSSVLDALLIGASPATGEGIARAVMRHQGLTQKARWLFWKAGDEGKAELAVTTRADSYRKCELALDPALDNSEIRIGCQIKWRIRNRSSTDTLNLLFRAPNECRAPKESRALEDVPSVRLVEINGNSLHVPLHELYTESARTGHREEAKAMIAEVVPGMKDVEILTEAEKPILYLIYEKHGVPAVLAGDGIHALVRVALELASCPDGVVLFEEPEVHQHPRAMGQTIRAVLAAVRRDIQVVITTHSLELIDYLVAESSEEDLEKLSLYRLGLKNGRLISVRHAGSEVAFARGDIDRDLR